MTKLNAFDIGGYGLNYTSLEQDFIKSLYL